MANIKGNHKEIRRTAILEYLKDERSLHEIAEHVGGTYYTIRRDVQDLIDEKVVQATGRLREGRMLFLAKPPHAVPVFTIKATHAERNLTDLALAYAEGDFADPSSVDFIRQFMAMPIELFHIAALFNSKDQRDIEAASKALEDLRQRLLRAHQIVDSISDLMFQFLRTNVLWDELLLKDMVTDVNAPGPVLISEMYDNFLRHNAKEQQ